jgi:hypothetical protein
MAPPPPLTGLPQATPALHPPPIPGGRLPPPFLGNKPGLCGLTSDEWHLVMKICIPGGQLPFSADRSMLIKSVAALFIVIIAIIILRLNSYKIEDLWFWVQEHAKMTRMGKLPDLYFMVRSILTGYPQLRRK